MKWHEECAPRHLDNPPTHTQEQTFLAMTSDSPELSVVFS